jgi:hypothetical protein
MIYQNLEQVLACEARKYPRKYANHVTPIGPADRIRRYAARLETMAKTYHQSSIYSCLVQYEEALELLPPELTEVRLLIETARDAVKDVLYFPYSGE